MPCNLHTAVLLEAGADAECVDATLLHIETYTSGVLACSTTLRAASVAMTRGSVVAM